MHGPINIRWYPCIVRQLGYKYTFCPNVVSPQKLRFSCCFHKNIKCLRWSIEDWWGFFLSAVKLYVGGLRRIAVPWNVCYSVVCDLHLSKVTGLKTKHPGIGLRFPYVPEVLFSPLYPHWHWSQSGRLSKGSIGWSLEVTTYLRLVPEAKKHWSHTSWSRLWLASKFTPGIQNLWVRCSSASIVTSVLVYYWVIVVPMPA